MPEGLDQRSQLQLCLLRGALSRWYFSPRARSRKSWRSFYSLGGSAVSPRAANGFIVGAALPVECSVFAWPRTAQCRDLVCYWRDMTLVPHLLNLFLKREICSKCSFSYPKIRVGN